MLLRDLISRKKEHRQEALSTFAFHLQILLKSFLRYMQEVYMHSQNAKTFPLMHNPHPHMYKIPNPHSPLPNHYLQPFTQQHPIHDRHPERHQIRQRTRPMHPSKPPIQPLHLLRMRPRIMIPLPIPRLLMFPLLHNPRCHGAYVEQINRVEDAYACEGEENAPAVFGGEDAGEGGGGACGCCCGGGEG